MMIRMGFGCLNYVHHIHLPSSCSMANVVVAGGSAEVRETYCAVKLNLLSDVNGVGVHLHGSSCCCFKSFHRSLVVVHALGCHRVLRDEDLK